MSFRQSKGRVEREIDSKTETGSRRWRQRDRQAKTETERKRSEESDRGKTMTERLEEIDRQTDKQTDCKGGTSRC